MAGKWSKEQRAKHAATVAKRRKIKAAKKKFPVNDPDYIPPQTGVQILKVMDHMNGNEVPEQKNQLAAQFMQIMFLILSK